ncbi:MAG: hypothetical protein HYU87_01680 [Chloroflexi bacterium]|nr:hypothetical protein [Chloroflexota bacterium]
MKEGIERGSGSSPHGSSGSAGTPGTAGPSESTSSGATSREARPKAEPTAIEQDQRDPDDPARLADEARALTAKFAADLRAAQVPIETEPPTVYKP